MPRRGTTDERLTPTLATLCLAALLVGTLAACWGPGQQNTPRTPAEWLRANAIPFDTAEPGSGFEDLMPLKELIGDARIVALGEATHGTHEFFQMKHRLVEFLVEEMGFDVLAVEASWAEANLINDFVHTGQGDEAALLAGLHYWTWNTQEMLNLIRWMRVHNQNPGDAPEVSFAGFDMQSPGMAMDNVIAYFQEVEPSYATVAIDQYACLRLRRLYDYAERSAADQTACRSRLEEVLDNLTAAKETYEQRSSPREFAAAEQSARVVLQAEDCLARFETCDRDRYMAENVDWLLEQAGQNAKIILWAHNGHVAGGAIAGDRSMGAYLRESHGEDMVIFCLTFGRGEFHAISHDRGTGRLGRLGIHEASPAPRESYEWYLRKARMPRLILDLRGASEDSPATTWLTRPHGLRSIGALYDPNVAPEEYFRDVRLAEEFDAVIYFEETTPSVPLSLALLRWSRIG